MLSTSLHTGSTWLGSELGDASKWTVSLSAEQISELLATSEAIARRKVEWQNVSRLDYDLPRWQSTILQLREVLEGGIGFARIRALPVEHISPELARTMLWGIGQHLGYPESQDAAGNLLHDVKDTGKDLDTDNIRAYQTNLGINYHNDGADAFMLLCYRAAASGGRSKIVSAISVFNEILSRRPDLASILQEPFDFDARGQERPGSPPYQRIPIYTYFQGYLNVLYKREYITLGQRFDDVPELTPLQNEALDEMDRVCDELALEFVMEPGDIIVANNYDLLHGRSAFEDTSAGSDGRHMLRLWLTLPNGRPLPPAFENTREFYHSYTRREQESS